MNVKDIVANAKQNLKNETKDLKGMDSVVAGLKNVYKLSVISKFVAENFKQQFKVVAAYPEIVPTVKFNFNDLAQLTSVSATIANDSKVDLRKVPKKIGDVTFKVTRQAKAK